MISTTLRKSTMAVAALGALGLGGAAMAGAADKTTTKSSTAKAAGRSASPQRQALSAADAAKVNDAALAKVPGATVLRTEAGGPYAAPYHAHIKTSDGTLRVVLVNARFEATTVQADRGRGGGRGHHGGPGHGGGGETPLTGDTKSQVEAAVLGKYPGATIVRSETNVDSSAPYEAHITTSAGKEHVILVGSDFSIAGTEEHPARP